MQQAALVLANFSFVVPSHHATITAALDKCAAEVRRQRNADHGFPSHRRNENYAFGTKTTVVPVGGSNLWATYSRMMTLAFAAGVAGRRTGYVTSSNLMEVWDAGTGRAPTFPKTCNPSGCPQKASS